MDSNADEIGLSIEETNKLRISLGLRPLNMEAPQQQSKQDMKAQEDVQKKKEQDRLSAEMRERIAAHKSARQQQSFLTVNSLGAADDGEDDMTSWVERNRTKVAEQNRRKLEEAEAERKRKELLDDGEDEDEGGGRGGKRSEPERYGRQDLAGLKVNHGLDDFSVMDGEGVILTLADKGILDEKGQVLLEEADELENVRIAEEQKRKKVREASNPKAKPLWEEDGKRRGILDKYDQEDEQTLRFDGMGGLEDKETRRREETRRVLEVAGRVLLESAAAPGTVPMSGVKSDYLTQGEVKKTEEKKRKRKERKIRSKVEEDPRDDAMDAVGTEGLIAQLEMRNGEASAEDLGSRSERLSAREKQEAIDLVQAEQKRARFEAAVEKSNLASAALKGGDADPTLSSIAAQEPAPKPFAEERKSVLGEGTRGWGWGSRLAVKQEEPEEIGEEEDMELQRSLERARRLAVMQQQPSVQMEEEPGNGVRPNGVGSLEAIAAAAHRHREEEERRIKEDILSGASSVMFNDSLDFVSNISTKKEEVVVRQHTLQGAGAGGALTVLLDGSKVEQVPSSSAQQPTEVTGLTIILNPKHTEVKEDVEMTEADAQVDEEEDEEERARRTTLDRRKKQKRRGGLTVAESLPSAPPLPASQVPDIALASITSQSTMGRGLSSVLELLKEKGTLAEKQVWAGRNNDKSKVALQGLEDVYTGGGQDDRVARSVEAALTQKDEFGRTMTPKERFRVFCHQFHGIAPSKDTEAKRLKQAQQELKTKKHASKEAEQASKQLALQQKAAQPFLVLSGKGAEATLKAVAHRKVPKAPKSNPPLKGPPLAVAAAFDQQVTEPAAVSVQEKVGQWVTTD